LDQQKQQQLRQELLKMRRELIERLDTLNAGGLAGSLSESVEELSAYDNHPADVATETFEREKDYGLRDNDLIQLDKVNDALKAMDLGTYGVCRRCGRQIDRQRLEAVPETTLCLDCRLKTEGSGERHPRPLEEDAFEPRSALSQKPYEPDQIGYDREDVWQDLTRGTEHAEGSGSGSYYGGWDNTENRGSVEFVDNIAYFKGADGMYYQDVNGRNAEDAPGPKAIGDEEAER